MKKNYMNWSFIISVILFVLLLFIYVCTLNEAIIGLLGTLTGAIVTSMFTSSMKGKELEVEKQKIKSDIRINRFHKILLPIYNLYTESDMEMQRDAEDSPIEGRGIRMNKIYELNKIFEDNMGYIDKDLYDVYKRVRNTYYSDIELSDKVMRYSQETYNPETEDFCEYIHFYFDNDRELYNEIEKQMKEINEDYL
ncbi:hypothetical protein NGC53_02500 [Aerococcus viridans]|uniref:hypothetical protein n=1 Tax=Aerococcus viridans TaxID=1377 RepID=UPI002DBE8AC6|nr:hypothetical protein [Aerococcus viridans]MEB7388689.1 hypothetical protein [Aerococcus viridans]